MSAGAPEGFEETARAVLALVGMPFEEADLAVLALVAAAFEPGIRLLDDADLTQLPLEANLDPGRAPTGREP